MSKANWFFPNEQTNVLASHESQIFNVKFMAFCVFQEAEAQNGLEWSASSEFRSVQTDGRKWKATIH